MRKPVASRQSPGTAKHKVFSLPSAYCLLTPPWRGKSRPAGLPTILNFIFISIILFQGFLLETTLAASSDSPRGPRPDGPGRESRPVKYVGLEKDPFYIKYPQGENIQEAAEVLLKAQKRMERRYGYVPPDWVPVIFYGSSKEFQEATGKSKLFLALVREDGLYFQPIRALRAKAAWQKVLAHEYTHWVQNDLTQKSCPHWLAEGLAILESGEGPDMERDFAQEKRRPRPSLKQIEQDIKNSQDQKKLNLAYFRAYQFCANLEDRFGIKKINQFLRGLGEGRDIDTSAQEAFGLGLEELVETWRKGRE